MTETKGRGPVRRRKEGFVAVFFALCVMQAAAMAQTPTPAIAPKQVAQPAVTPAELTPARDQAGAARDTQQITGSAAAAIQDVLGSGSGSQARAEALAGDGRPSSAPLLPRKLSLYAGQAVVHRVPGTLRRVAVGNGEVVNVYTVGRGEVVLIGTAAGDTNVHLWLGDGSQRDVPVTVTPIRGDGLADTVRELLGDVPGLVVKSVGPNVIVSGRDLDEATTQRIALLQKAYPQILNFAGQDPVGMRPMVMMDVQIMEFNKNAVDELGIRWDSVIGGPVGGLIRDVTTNNYFRVLPKDNDTFEDIKDDLPTKLPGTQAYFGIATTIASSINLLMNRGKAWVLASPKLSAKSGSNATFLVGGEVPIVIPSILGQSQVEYKEYGIRLNISPTVNAANQIATSIMAEVSRIDPAVQVEGVPGFLTRRTETEINVHAGETIVISGLLDTSASKTVDKFPILGDIPIIGRLFRSDGFRGNRTELVVFVTPRIVTPASQENIDALRRGDAIRESLETDTTKLQRKHIN